MSRNVLLASLLARIESGESIPEINLSQGVLILCDFCSNGAPEPLSQLDIHDLAAALPKATGLIKLRIYSMHVCHGAVLAHMRSSIFYCVERGLQLGRKQRRCDFARAARSLFRYLCRSYVLTLPSDPSSIMEFIAALKTVPQLGVLFLTGLLMKF